MNNLKVSSADHVDNHRRLLFLGMFLMSLVFAVKSGFYFVHDDMKNYLQIIGKILFGLAAITVVITVFWKWIFIPRNERYLLSSNDSYANQMMNKACKITWILTVILLSLITSTTSKDHSVLPAEFYLNLTLFFMLAVFSLSFFILFRDGPIEQF